MKYVGAAFTSAPLLFMGPQASMAAVLPLSEKFQNLGAITDYLPPDEISEGVVVPYVSHLVPAPDIAALLVHPPQWVMILTGLGASMLLF